MQNFRAKPRTAMQGAPDASVLEYVAAVAVARLVMGPRMRIQVPPNLSDPAEFELLLRAGADDWGGVSPLTADHVNPERPWPHLSDLADRTAELGFALQERLTAHPEYIRDPATWIDPALHPAVRGARRSRNGARRRAHRSRTHPLPANPHAPVARSAWVRREGMGSARRGRSPSARRPTRWPSTTPSGRGCCR